MKHKTKSIVTIFTLLALMALITGSVLADDGDTPLTIDQLSPAQIAKSSGHTAVMSNIESVGVARLIVEVKTARNYVGIDGLSLADAQREMDKVSAAQTNFAAEFPALASDMGTLKTVPFVSVWVTNETEYAELLASSTVLSVQHDFPKKVTGNLNAPQAMPDANTFIDTQVMWNAGYDGTGLTIAILDTGVDSTHDFLDAGKVVAEFCHSTEYAGYAATPLCAGGVQDTAGAGEAMPYVGNCPAGECDHGTHVAGIAAGTDASFSGIAPDATLIAAQVFTRFDWDGVCGDGGSPCVASFDYDQMLAMEDTIMLALGTHPEYPGVTLDVASLNMSLGGGQSFSHCDEEEEARKDLIDTLKSLGTATVISAGNNGFVDSTGYPGCVSTAFTIGATFNEPYSSWVADDPAPFSNAQASILDMWAPGVFVESSIPVVSGPGGTNPTEEYHGTSMSAPIVAGAFALFEEAYPTLSVNEVFAIMDAAGVEVTDNRADPSDPPTIAPRIDFTDALTVVPGPTLLSEPNGAIVYNGYYPSFEWTPVSGVDSYTFEYSEDNTFTTSTTEVTASTSVTEDELTYGTYYWRVKSTTGGVDSNWSPMWTLIVSPYTDGPTLVAPEDGSKSADTYPTFEWEAMDDADDYTVEYSMDDTFATSETRVCASTSCPPNADLAYGTWYWRVKASNAYQEGPYGSASSFTVQAAPSILGPADGHSTTDHTPNFDWEDYPGAVSYVIQVSPNADFSTLPINHTVTNSFFAPGVAINNNTYYWRVVANTGGELTPWSEVREITITGAPGNAQPQVVGPDNGATLTTPRPTFDWDEVATAVRYRFQMSLTEGFGVWIVNQTVTDSEFTPGVDFNDGTYWWRVQAEGGGDSSWFSIKRSFTIDTSP